MTHPRRVLYRPGDLLLLPEVEGDVGLETVLTILAQNKVTLSLRANGALRARKLGYRRLHPDLASLVARHAEALLAVVRAHQAQRPPCGRDYGPAVPQGDTP